MSKSLPPIFINLIYVFAIGLNIVLLRYFSLRVDALNNNGVRFCVGALALLIWVWLKYRHDFTHFRRQPLLLVYAFCVGLLMCVNMYFWLEGAALTNAVTASISSVLGMPFGILVAGIFFQDERQKLKQKTFWIGCALTLCGALGFVLYGKTMAVGDHFLLGAFFLLLSIFIRNLQNVIVKLVNKKLSVFSLSFITSLTTGITSLALSQQTGKLAELSQISLFLLVGLMLIGIYAIGVGMVLTFDIIQKQGLVTYQILELIIPISTALIAYILLGEQIAFSQLMFAVVVIIGASLALNLFPHFHLRKKND
ncbi:multidrug transporter [[Actinobacillus] muris]|uniref:Multidrug transporter n=1 Tax=Muribacter muris TaxID=67855 RepID=A0A0J5P9P6_9PAST|nr:DMT family transporter [Muribacter muris]KMK52450.1 multidrug transporter [[Actinobacillus] muris] [Muribacter muris]